MDTSDNPKQPERATEWLHFHHRSYYYPVAKEGSLKKAAEELHVSQPSIAEQIRELEDAVTHIDSGKASGCH